MPSRAIGKWNSDRQAHALPNQRILDIEHLDHHTFGEVELRNELLGLFGEQLGQQMNVLQQCTSHADWLVATHTLKGSARAVGAWMIDEIAETLENLPPNGWLELRSEPMDSLSKAVQECLAAIGALTTSR